MHDDISTVNIMFVYHTILRGKAEEQGVSMKHMLETILRDTWPSEFKRVDEHNELVRTKRQEERNKLSHGEPEEINIESLSEKKQ